MKKHYPKLIALILMIVLSLGCNFAYLPEIVNMQGFKIQNIFNNEEIVLAKEKPSKPDDPIYDGPQLVIYEPSFYSEGINNLELLSKGALITAKGTIYNNTIREIIIETLFVLYGENGNVICQEKLQQIIPQYSSVDYEILLKIPETLTEEQLKKCNLKLHISDGSGIDDRFKSEYTVTKDNCYFDESQNNLISSDDEETKGVINKIGDEDIWRFVVSESGKYDLTIETDNELKFTLLDGTTIIDSGIITNINFKNYNLKNKEYQLKFSGEKQGFYKIKIKCTELVYGENEIGYEYDNASNKLLYIIKGGKRVVQFIYDDNGNLIQRKLIK